MPFKIVRNDITKMNTEAIVNTANDQPRVGTGCDFAVYNAAGHDELLSYRRDKIGAVKEGEVFITPGFHLPAKYIIHAVSPLYIDGSHREEELLRSCYRKSLALAAAHGIRSIAFPLISTGGFGYPKEEGMRIAVDEIHAFLLHSDMQVYLVVFDEKATRMGRNLYPGLEAYIDRHYVEERYEEEYDDALYSADHGDAPYSADHDDALYDADHDSDVRYEAKYREARRRRFNADADLSAPAVGRRAEKENKRWPWSIFKEKSDKEKRPAAKRPDAMWSPKASGFASGAAEEESSVREDFDAESSVLESFEAEPLYDADFAIEEIERKLADRIKHMSDTFPEYLLYLISEKGMKNSDVYKRAIVDKKVFSKIKNNPDYHPQKLTALCLCIGARLNLDETRDLLARAGYALSPCDKTDIIFSYFIENGIYDMIELDIQLEEHGLPCIIT